MNRKKFIEKSTRGLFLGGLAIVGAIAVSRKGFNQENCNNNFLCKGCKKLDDCALPEAKEMKR